MGMTRQRFFQLLAGLGAARLAATAGVEVSASKKRRRRHRNAGCPEDRKNEVCHCPPGLGGAGCRVLCVGTGGGHDNDPFDCMCAGSIHGVPDCEPGSGRCPPGGNDRGESCGGPTTCTGTCTTTGDCAFISVPGCTCNAATGQCEGPCIEDGQPASAPTQCCSGQLCPTDNICGACLPVTCAGSCAAQITCTNLGGDLCVCLGLPTGTC